MSTSSLSIMAFKAGRPAGSLTQHVYKVAGHLVDRLTCHVKQPSLICTGISANLQGPCLLVLQVLAQV